MSMGAMPLEGRRILLVEDNFSIAKSLATLFIRYGAIIVGPAGTVEGAMALIEAEPHIDGAVLDVHVRDKLVYPAAEALRRRHTRMVFITGDERESIAPEFAEVSCMLKPWNAVRLMNLLLECDEAGSRPQT
jgi:CheY-like chemotaxis protein